MAAEVVRLSPETAPLLLAPEAAEVFDNPVDIAQLAAFLSDPGHMMALAVDGGRLVGMASATVLLHPDKAPECFVNEVGVAERHRNRGIGRRLVEAVLAEARARGCSGAWLGTETGNDAARACYARVPGVRELPPENRTVTEATI